MAVATATIVGRLGRDPKTTYTKNGKALTTFSIATESGWGEHKRTTWWTVKSWGESRLNLFGKLKKGDRVVVSGEVYLDVWTDKEGKDREFPTVDAKIVEPLWSGRKKSGGQASAGGDAGDVPF